MFSNIWKFQGQSLLSFLRLHLCIAEDAHLRHGAVLAIDRVGLDLLPEVLGRLRVVAEAGVLHGMVADVSLIGLLHGVGGSNGRIVLLPVFMIVRPAGHQLELLVLHAVDRALWYLDSSIIITIYLIHVLNVGTIALCGSAVRARSGEGIRLPLFLWDLWLALDGVAAVMAWAMATIHQALRGRPIILLVLVDEIVVRAHVEGDQRGLAVLRVAHAFLGSISHHLPAVLGV